MKSGIGYLAELQEMREKMDRVWSTLLEESPIAKGQEIWEWIEKIPTFEGTGRSSCFSWEDLRPSVFFWRVWAQGPSQGDSILPQGKAS